MSKISKQIYQSDTGILVPLNILHKGEPQKHMDCHADPKQVDNGLSREQKQDAINRLINYFRNL